MRIEFALCVWSQNARFVVTSHCSRCVLDLVVGVYKDLGPSAPGATAPALLDCRLVVSRSIYIYKFYIFARARCYVLITTFLLLVFTTARCYSLQVAYLFLQYFVVFVIFIRQFCF